MSITDCTHHGDTAMAVARETGWNLDGETDDRDWSTIDLGPVGQHRDSGALDRSNFRVVVADLERRFGDAVAVVSFGHWGVGWVEEVAFDNSLPEVREAVQQWREALADYPVADEMDFSELEWSEDHPDGDDRCYSDDDDCGCGREKA